MNVRRWLLLAMCWVVGPVTQAGVDPELAKEDAFLAGALVMLIEHQLGWERDTYELQVLEGVATVTLVGAEDGRRTQLQEAVPQLTGLQGLNIAAEAPGAESAAAAGLATSEQKGEEEPSEAAKQAYSMVGLTPDTVPFPVGDLFWTLLADPKQPQFFVSLRHYDSPIDTTTVGAVGFGETFGLYRREGKHPGDGLQIGIDGGLFAQFNMGAASNDLINADYIIGIPATYRRGPWSSRLRVYHQSSHLGDEFLLNTRPERINLSFESLEALVSYDWRQLRVYGGGEYLFSREPEELDPEGLHGGLEFRGTKPWLWGGRLVGGLDLRSWREHDWDVDASLTAGLEFGATQSGRRRLRIMAEAYEGHSPHGQFYEDDIRYLGVGLYFGF